MAPSDDPETNFFAAAHLSYCGEVARAGALLSRAIAGGYCSAVTIDADPFFVKLRETSRFTALLEQARACRRRVGL